MSLILNNDEPGLVQQKVTAKDYLIVCLIALLATTFYQIPLFIDPSWIDDDTRVLFFTWRYANPSLFPGDLISDYVEHFFPLGAQAIYRLLVPIFGLFTIAKFLPILLMTITALGLFRLSVSFDWGRRSAYIATFAFLILCHSDVFYTAVPRVFAAPILIFFLLALKTRKWPACAVLSVAALLVYPLLFPVILLATCALLVWEIAAAKEEEFKGLLFQLILISVVPIGIGLWRVAAYSDAPAYEMPSYDEVLSMPETGPGGRADLASQIRLDAQNILSPDFLHRLLFSRNGSLDTPARFWLAIMVAGLLLAAWGGIRKNRGQHTAHRVVLPIVLIAPLFFGPFLVIDRHLTGYDASFYAAAYLLSALSIAMPSFRSLFRRELATTLAIALICAAAIFALHPWLSLRLFTAAGQLKYVMPVLLSLMLGPALVYLSREIPWRFSRTFPAACGVFIFATSFARPPFDVTRCDETPLYQYLSELPVSARVIGHPEGMDCIPLYSRRAVVVSPEGSPIMFRSLWQQMKARTYDSLDLFYATDSSPLADICKRQDHPYIVIQNRFLEQSYTQGEHPYFLPFTNYIRDNAVGPFYFQNLPKPKHLFEWPGGYVTSCADLLSSSEKMP